MARTQIDPSLVPASQNTTNILINGGMQFWQRNTSFTTPATATYVADRWKVSTDEASGVTVTQEGTTKDSGDYSMKVAVSSAGASKIWSVVQFLENYLEYKGKTVTFSVRVNANTASAVKIGLYDGATPVVYSSYHSGSGAFETLSVSYTVGTSPAYLQVFIGMPTAGDKKTGTYYFDSAMLSIGSIVTPFVPKDKQFELAQCQRYYEKSYDLNTVPGTSVGGATAVMGAAAQIGTTVMESSIIPFKVTKYATPTLTLYTIGGTSGSWSWTNTSGTNTARVSSSTFLNAYCFDVTQSSAVEYRAFGHFTAEAEL